MNLDFKILWVEDQPELINDYSEYLELELKRLGFKAIFITATGYDKVLELMDSQPKDDDYDLILVDFDLGDSGGQGDDAARKIRDKFPHREMVFYSGHSPEKLRTAAADKKIDGVYFAHRPDLVDDVFSVIENMLRKVVDLSHTRGIIMAETSEIDHCIEQCLNSSFERLTDDRKKAFHNNIVEIIHERYREQQGKLDKLTDHKKFPELLASNHIMTSFDKTRAMLRFLNSYTQIPNKKTHYNTVKDYQEKFQPIRNSLAHGTVTKRDGNKILKFLEEEINEETMRKWRVELMGYREQIKAIANEFDVVFESE